MNILSVRSPYEVLSSEISLKPQEAAMAISSVFYVVLSNQNAGLALVDRCIFG